MRKVIEIKFETPNNENKMSFSLLSDLIKEIEALKKYHEEEYHEEIEILFENKEGSWIGLFYCLNGKKKYYFNNEKPPSFFKSLKSYFKIVNLIEEEPLNFEEEIKRLDEENKGILEFMLKNESAVLKERIKSFKRNNAILKKGYAKKIITAHEDESESESINDYDQNSNFDLKSSRLKKWIKTNKNEDAETDEEEKKEFKNEKMLLYGGDFFEENVAKEQHISIAHFQEPKTKFLTKYNFEKIKIENEKKEKSFIVCDYNRIYNKKNKKIKIELVKIHKIFLSKHKFKEKEEDFY